MSTSVMHSADTKAFDIVWVREQFPSLTLQFNRHASAFLDGPAGTQVPKQVMDAVCNIIFWEPMRILRRVSHQPAQR